ncbi:MAG: hypothetical protein QXZ30_01575 [Candidatus Bilamarchaeaceae archaeon]
MNIGRGFKVAMMPIAGILLLAVINGLSSLFMLIPGINFCLGILQCLFFPLTLLLNIVLFIYAGYLIAKSGMEMVDAAAVGGVTGVLAVIISTFFSIIANFITTTFGLAVTTAATTLGKNNNVLTTIFNVGVAGANIVMQLACFIGFVIVAAIIGAALAAIGALIAGTKK